MATQREKILIVDDDASFLEYMKRFLAGHLDVDIITEQKPINAISRINNGEDFAVILLDVLMPIINGFETAEQLRKANISAPIIFITGAGLTNFNEEKLKAIGLTDIVLKTMDSFSNVLLINKLKLFIDNHQACRLHKEQSEKHYQNIFEHAPVALYEEDLSVVKNMVDDLVKDVGLEGFMAYLDQHPNFLERAAANIKVSQVNKRAIDVFEASSFEDLRCSVPRTFLPESYPVFKQELLAIARGDKEFEADLLFVTLKGRTLEAHIYIDLPETKEEYKFIVVSITDFSEIKKLERKAQYLGTAISRSPAVVIRFQNGVQWPVECISDNVFSLTGYLAEDFISSKISWRSLIHPEDIANVERELAENIARKEISFCLDFRLITSNLSQKHVRLLTNINLDINNKLNSWQGIATDISKEIQMQKKLESTVGKWRTLLESTRTAYMILNEKGFITDANSQLLEMFGAEKPEALVGLSPRNMVCASDIAKYDAAFIALFEGKNIENLDLCLKTSEPFNCKVAWISINASLIENGKKQIFCVIRDVTNTKTEELRKFIENQKQRDKLRQNISKIRNKLLETKTETHNDKRSWSN